MENRRFKRFTTRFHSVVLSNGRSYAGSIDNFSEEGLAYKMSTFHEAIKELLPEKIVNVIILIPSGETVSLNCEIRWNDVSCDDKKLCMGMKILDLPEKYKKFLENLN